ERRHGRLRGRAGRRLARSRDDGPPPRGRGRGARAVTRQPERVREMFDRISPSYDRMNMLMSGGMDGRWRRLAVRAAAVRPGDSAIDVCCGTGDLAVELRRAVGPSGRVVGLDFAPQMLEVARRTSAAVAWAGGAALALPFWG